MERDKKEKRKRARERERVGERKSTHGLKSKP